MDDPRRHTIVDASLAEFRALRMEILERSRTQGVLVNLNLTAIAAVVSIIATNKGDQSLLLLLCPISAALGLLWADHARTIADLGTYVAEEIAVPLQEIAAHPVLGWEQKSAAYRKDRKNLLSYRLPLFLIFAGPPLSAISVTALADPKITEFDGLLYAYWGAGVALTVYLAIVLGKLQFAAHQARDWPE